MNVGSRPQLEICVPAFALVAILAAFFNPADTGLSAPDIEFVQRVVDGDTLLLGTGERVRLEYDPSNAARGHKEHPWGRTLAYIFLDDGTLLRGYLEI